MWVAGGPRAQRTGTGVGGAPWRVEVGPGQAKGHHLLSSGQVLSRALQFVPRGGGPVLGTSCPLRPGLRGLWGVGGGCALGMRGCQIPGRGFLTIPAASFL